MLQPGALRPRGPIVQGYCGWPVTLTRQPCGSTARSRPGRGRVRDHARGGGAGRRGRRPLWRASRRACGPSTAQALPARRARADRRRRGRARARPAAADGRARGRPERAGRRGRRRAGVPGRAVASSPPVTVPGWIGAHKWADRRLLERAEAELGAAVPLLVDADGSVLEGFALQPVRGPRRRRGHAARPTAACCRASLGRGRSRWRGRPASRCVERALTLDELAAADEVFMTGGVRGVEPVGRCAGLGEWDSGEITARVACRASARLAGCR